MEPLLEINHVNYAYHSMQGETPALQNIHFNVLIARSGIRTSPDWEEAIPPKAGSQAAPILSSFSPAQIVRASCRERVYATV